MTSLTLHAHPPCNRLTERAIGRLTYGPALSHLSTGSREKQDARHRAPN